MKSGMVAAETVAAALENGRPPILEAYPSALARSWVWPELHRVRNIRPGFAKFGLLGGLFHAALDTYILRGKEPWTLKNHDDHKTLDPAARSKRIAYSRPDGVLTFDRLSSVFLSNTNHAEDQPPHLKLRDSARWKPVNWVQHRSPESRYCPAAVYEAAGPHVDRTLKDAPEAAASDTAPADSAHLVINAQNCVHCKTCDIKDPTQNIDWTTPEGGGGPNYIGGM
jgi:electron-transferring-flavoprotein dehydrogenase